MVATLALALLLSAGHPARAARDDAPRATIDVPPGEDAQRRLQEALLDAEPGTLVRLHAGRYELRHALSLDVEGVCLRGAGRDATVLSFAGQSSGSEGLLVTSAGFEIEDLAIEDTAGDGLKVSGATGVSIRRVRVEWTGGPSPKNGGYGIYPVQCANVLVEECVVRGASDAGIYVGQSRAIVVRKNTVERNVAGIEIENSRGADVYENVASDNAGGILVFDLPGLPVKDGGDVRVFANDVRANNHANFAAAGNLVAIVPPGTGVMVMAMDHVEIFRNEIRDHRTVNLALVSYDITLAVDREREPREKDEGYQPWAEAISVHDNVFAGGGDRPSGPIGLFLRALLGAGPVPDIVYDGIANPARIVDGEVAPGWGIYLADNGDADFADLNLAREDRGPARGPAARAGKIRRIEPVRLPGVE